MADTASSDKNESGRLDAYGLWASLAALAVSIAGSVRGFFDLAEISSWVVENWEWVTRNIRQQTWKYLHALLDIDLSWVTARLVPTMLVLVSIIVFSLRRGMFGLIGRRLGLSDQAPGLSTVVAFILFAAMVVFEQSYFSASAEGTSERPSGMSVEQQQYAKQYFVECRLAWGLDETSPFDSFCAFKDMNSPVVKASAEFNLYDWLVIGVYVGLLGYVVLRLQEEVIVAFVLAAAFIGLGHLVSAVRAVA